MSHPGTVEPELLAELDDVQGRLVSRAGIGAVEDPDGEEAELGQRSRR